MKVGLLGDVHGDHPWTTYALSPPLTVTFPPFQRAEFTG